MSSQQRPTNEQLQAPALPVWDGNISQAKERHLLCKILHLAAGVRQRGIRQPLQQRLVVPGAGAADVRVRQAAQLR